MTDSTDYGRPQTYTQYLTPQQMSYHMAYQMPLAAQAYAQPVPYSSPSQTFQSVVPSAPPVTATAGSTITPSGQLISQQQQLPEEQSYIENILRMNLGKRATIYMTFENNSQWNAKIFKGVLEAAGRDHIVVSDPKTGTRYLLLMVNLDYITFDEPLSYTLPFGR